MPQLWPTDFQTVLRCHSGICVARGCFQKAIWMQSPPLTALRDYRRKVFNAKIASVPKNGPEHLKHVSEKVVFQSVLHVKGQRREINIYRAFYFHRICNMLWKIIFFKFIFFSVTDSYLWRPLYLLHFYLKQQQNIYFSHVPYWKYLPVIFTFPLRYSE